MSSDVPGTSKPKEMRDQIRGGIRLKWKIQPATIEEMSRNPFTSHEKLDQTKNFIL